MTTLVTGATGLVGGELVDQLLASGERVRAFIRDEHAAASLRERGVEVVIGDVRDPHAFDRPIEGADVVLHCAAAVGRHFSKGVIYETNLAPLGRLLVSLGRAGRGRLVFISSVNVLGTRNLDPATEDLPCRYSHDPAADVKVDAERLLQSYQGRIDATVIRPGCIYGARDRHNLPKLVRSLQRGKFAYIGSRDNIVPIVHVSDVAQAALLAARAPIAAGRLYNVTDGSRTTIGEFVDCLAQQLGCPAPRKVLPYLLPYLGCRFFDLLRLFANVPPPINQAGLRFLGTSRYVDISRARRELGYTPRVHYREGIAAALPACKEQQHGKTAVETCA